VDATRASKYHFVTKWTLNASIEAVWEQLSRPESWPHWWRGVVAVELIDAGDSRGVGAYRRMTWKSALPYQLRFNIRTIRLDPPRVIEGQADGELCGVGRWDLTPTQNGTEVRYVWTVDATEPWMRWLAPVARPIFQWNHDVIMRWGFEGLQRQLSP
jgi:uncharacterized protein YndB with AHSA1/START domain